MSEKKEPKKTSGKFKMGTGPGPHEYDVFDYDDDLALDMILSGHNAHSEGFEDQFHERIKNLKQNKENSKEE